MIVIRSRRYGRRGYATKDLHRGDNLATALRELANVIDSTLGTGATLIPDWGIRLQFDHGGQFFDLRLMNERVEIESMSEVPADETQEAPRVQLDTQPAPRKNVRRNITQELKRATARI